MEFNTKKCEILSFSRKTAVKTIHHPYMLHNTILKRVQSAKYLGVTFTTSLSWNKHIANITSKGNRMLGLLRRNLNIGSEDLRQKAYSTLVRPLLEYSGTVWDPYTLVNIDKLEKVQRRAARYVCRRYHNTSSVSDMLDHLQWQTLRERRIRSKLLMMHKITHNHVAIDKTKHLSPRQNRSSRNFNILAYRQITSTSNYHKHSFFASTIPLWNKLPNMVVTTTDPDSFRQQLSGLTAGN